MKKKMILISNRILTSKSFVSCNSIRGYSTYRASNDMLLNRVFSSIKDTCVQDPHRWLIIANHNYYKPEAIADVNLHALSIMDLLHQFAYTSLTGYAKFGILLTTQRSYGEKITYSMGSAIPLTDDGGNLLPKKWVYSQLFKELFKNYEKYEGDDILRVTIRVYMEKDKKQERSTLSDAERSNLLHSVLIELSNNTDEKLTESNAITARKLRESRHPKTIPALNECNTTLRPFIVSDLETLL